MNIAHRHPIAIDLCEPDSMRAIQVAGSRATYHVRAYAETAAGAPPPGEAPSADAHAAFIRDASHSRSFQGKAIALLPPTGMVNHHHLRLTMQKGETLEMAIAREAHDVLGDSLMESVVDYLSVQPDPAGEKGVQVVLLATMKQTDVNHYIKLVRQAGGTLEVLAPTATGLLQVQALHEPIGSSPVLLCHIGTSSTTVAVANGQGLIASRDIAWGTHTLRQRLAGNLELQGQRRDEDFLLLKHGISHAVKGTGEQSPGHHYSATVAQLLLPDVDLLVRDLHGVLGYVRATAPGIVFGDLFLYGDGTRVDGMDAYLAQELNLRVRATDPMATDAISGPTMEDAGTRARFTLALGLALRRVRWL